MASRQEVVDIVNSWKGLKESDGSYKPIIDIYNSIRPLPESYRLKYTDSWGPATVSAAYKQAGADDIFPCECSCARMISKAKDMGIYIEDTSYLPDDADVVMFDWQESLEYDDKSTPDQAGVVVSVNKTAKTFVVVEGNKDDSVGTRTMAVNSKFIRGFICPNFPVVIETVKASNPSAQAVTAVASLTAEISQEEVNPSTSANKIEVVGTGTLSKVPAGTALKLVNTELYASAKAKNYSSKKTGTYYIWSVDTINGKVRITNSEKNVGVKGQVTGWITTDDAISNVISTPASTSTSNTPTYQVNAVYVTQVSELAVRRGPGTNYGLVGYDSLTPNAKKYDKDKDGYVDKGMKVTCLETKIVGNNVWIRIPSGWVAAYYNKQYYVK